MDFLGDHRYVGLRGRKERGQVVALWTGDPSAPGHLGLRQFWLRF